MPPQQTIKIMDITIDVIYDIETLMEWRAEVIRAVFGIEPGKQLLDENRKFYERHLADGSHLALIARVDGRDVGCGNVCFYYEMPSPDNPAGRCAYIMNIYVRPPYRCNGIAHRLVARLADVSRDLRCGKIYLETTDNAAPIYSSLGFRPMTNMMKL